MLSNTASQQQQQETQQKLLYYPNQFSSKAQFPLRSNRQHRSSSRSKPLASSIQRNILLNSSKGTSHVTQESSTPLQTQSSPRYHQQRPFNQSASLPLAPQILPIHNKSYTHSTVNHSSNHDKRIANSPYPGIYSTSHGAACQSNNSKEQFKLLCRKHEKPIQKICTKLSCEQQSVLCPECYFDNQQHIGMHKEHIFSFEDFIAVCKSFSLRFKDDFACGNKPLSMLLMKLERQVTKYQLHVKREEEKIDEDFNLLIRQFTCDMEGLKERLKGQLNTHLHKVENIAKSLKTKAFDLQTEKQSNLDATNDFDDFLRNLKEIATQKAPSQNYNFKKLFQNISPLLGRYKEQIQKLIAKKTSNSSNPNVVINTEQSETLSCCSGITGLSYLAINLDNSPHLAPIKDLFSDFKVLSGNKPYYKNKGECQKLYAEALADIKRIYHDLSDNLSLFLESPMIKLAADVNKEKMEALVIPEKPQVNELQFIKKTDYMTLKDQQTVKHIEFIKTVSTTHTQGILALVIVDDETYVTAGSADKTVKVFSMKDHRFLKEIRFQSDITALSRLKRSDGSIMVLVGLYGGFAILNQCFEILKIMEGEHDANVTSIVGLKDHETVITASSDPKIVVWNVFNDDIPIRKYFDHKDTIYSLELFPCGKFLASGGRDRSIKVWKLRYYNEQYRNGALEKMILDTDIRDAHSTDITAIKSLKHCKDILLSGSANGEIKIWELEDSTCIQTIKNVSGWIYKFIMFERPQNLDTERILERLENAITHVAHVSPFKSKDTSLSKKSSYYLNTAGYQQATTNKTSLVPPSSMSMIHSQKKLKSKQKREQLKNVQFLTASFDGTLKLWNATSETPLDSQKMKNCFDCFPFGAVAAFQKDNETRIHIFTTGNKNDACINVWNVY